MSEKIHLTAKDKTRLPDADIQNAVRFCPKCGRVISLDQKICDFCKNTGTISRPVQSRRKKAAVVTLIIVLFFFLLLTALYLTR